MPESQPPPQRTHAQPLPTSLTASATTAPTSSRVTSASSIPADAALSASTVSSAIRTETERADWVRDNLAKICPDRALRVKFRALDNAQIAKAYMRSYETDDDREEALMTLQEILAKSAGATPLADQLPQLSSLHHSNVSSISQHSPPTPTRQIYVVDTPNAAPNPTAAAASHSSTASVPPAAITAPAPAPGSLEHFLAERISSNPELLQRVVAQLRLLGVEGREQGEWLPAMLRLSQEEGRWSTLQLKPALSARFRNDLAKLTASGGGGGGGSGGGVSGSGTAIKSAANVLPVAVRPYCTTPGSCPTCGLPDSWQEHNASCKAMWSNLAIREKIVNMEEFSGRPRAEVMLVARQYALDREDGVTRAFNTLSSGLHLPTWRARFDDGGRRAPKSERAAPPRQAPPQPEVTCVTCYAEVALDEVYTSDCPAQPAHRTCLDCIARAFAEKVKAKRALACPLCPEKTMWIIYPDEARTLAKLFKSRHFDTIGLPNAAKLIDYATEISMQLTLQAMKDGVKCPTPNCKMYVVLRDAKERSNIRCTGCSASFCSHCRGAAHYRTSCADVQAMMTVWLQWRTERGPAYRLQQAHLRTQAAEHATDVKRVRDENQILLTAYRQLEADERAFEQTCKLCPSCGRRIQRTEGCDAMVCGRDAHGNVQMGGCGHHFGWTSAPPYRSAMPPLKQLEEKRPPPPPNQTKHPEELLCDGCHKQIVGLRFECVHCPHFNYCEGCDAVGRGSDGSVHPKEHVFQVIGE